MNGLSQKQKEMMRQASAKGPSKVKSSDGRSRQTLRRMALQIIERSFDPSASVPTMARQARQILALIESDEPGPER